MLNIRKRISDLLESTSSIEAKLVCKEVLEAFSSAPESHISESLSERLKTVSDSDKHVEKFIAVTSKLNKVNNLSVNEALSKLKACPIAGYSGFGYNIAKIENAVIAQNAPAYMVIDPLIESISSFTWEPAVKEILESLIKVREENAEEILTLKGIQSLGGSKASFLFNDAIAKLESHFYTPTNVSRSSILESLGKFSYNPGVKELLEGLRKFSSDNGKTELIVENSNVNIVPAYSYVYKLDESTEFFFVKDKVYKKLNEGISLASEEEIKSLPEAFKSVYTILNSPAVSITEGKITVFAKRSKVELFENESGVIAKVNGNEIASKDIARTLMSTGILRMDESVYANAIQTLADNFDKIYDMDFVKVLESKLYSGVYSVLMNVNNSLSIAKVNPAMKLDEFATYSTVNEARSEVLNFLGYDIKESFSEFLDEEEKTLNALKESQKGLVSRIESLEREIQKINESLKDSYIAGNAKVSELKAVLESELETVKSEYSILVESIKRGGKKQKDSDLSAYRDAKDSKSKKDEETEDEEVNEGQIFSADVYTQQLDGYKFPNETAFKHYVSGKPFVLYNKKGKGVLQLEVEGNKPNQTINLCELDGKNCLKTWNVSEIEAKSKTTKPSETLTKEVEAAIATYFKSGKVNESAEDESSLEDKFKEVTTPAKYAELVDEIIATEKDAVKAAELLQDTIYANKASRSFVENRDNIEKNKAAFNKFTDHYKLLDEKVAKKVRTALGINEAFGIRYSKIFTLNENAGGAKLAETILDEHKSLTKVSEVRDFLLAVLSDVHDAEEAVKIVEKALADEEVYNFVKGNKQCKQLLDLFSQHYELDDKSWSAEVMELFNIKESVEGFKIGDTVKIISSDVVATINSITENTVVLITDEGDTVEATVEDITNLDAELANAIDKNNNAAADVTNDLETLSESLVELFESNKTIESALDLEHFVIHMNRTCTLHESVQMLKKLGDENPGLGQLIKENEEYSEIMNMWADRYGVDEIKKYNEQKKTVK